MRSIHILHHSISPFVGQYPEGDPVAYNSGIPMRYARAIRRLYPEMNVEVWRPEATVKRNIVWTDDDGVVHRIFPSIYLRYNFELSLPLLQAVQQARLDRRAHFWVHGIYNAHAYLLGMLLQHSPAIAQSHGGFPARAMVDISRHRWLRSLYWLLHAVEKLTLHRYPRIFALGTQERKYLLDHLGIDVNRIAISPMGIDFDQFCPGDRSMAQAECGLASEMKVVLYAGRLAREKGVDDLIKAFSMLHGESPGVQLVLVGSGPLENELKAQAQDWGIDAHVRFEGYVSPNDMPKWYRAADVTVIPSPIDWFPQVAMESMACGTPIVMTQGGGAPDIVCGFECGVLTPPSDPQRLCGAIRSVLDGSARRTPNTARGRELFDWHSKLSRSFELLSKMQDDRAG